MAALGVEIGRVALSFSPSPAAAAQALAEGGVDLAFLPVEDFLAGGGGQAVLADGEPLPLSEERDSPSWRRRTGMVWPACWGSPGSRPSGTRQ